MPELLKLIMIIAATTIAINLTITNGAYQYSQMQKDILETRNRLELEVDSLRLLNDKKLDQTFKHLDNAAALEDSAKTLKTDSIKVRKDDEEVNRLLDSVIKL